MHRLGFSIGLLFACWAIYGLLFAHLTMEQVLWSCGASALCSLLGVALWVGERVCPKED